MSAQSNTTGTQGNMVQPSEANEMHVSAVDGVVVPLGNTNENVNSSSDDDADVGTEDESDVSKPDQNDHGFGLNQPPKSIAFNPNNQKMISRFEFKPDKKVCMEDVRGLFGGGVELTSEKELNLRLAYTRLLKKDVFSYFSQYTDQKLNKQWKDSGNQQQRSMHELGVSYAQLNPKTDQRKMKTMQVDIFNLLTQGKGMPKGWETKAEMVYMKKNSFVYIENISNQGSKRLAKGCIARAASRALINARKKIFRYSKKETSHGLIMSANKPNGTNVLPDGMKFQQTRKDQSFRKSYVYKVKTEGKSSNSKLGNYLSLDDDMSNSSSEREDFANVISRNVSFVARGRDVVDSSISEETKYTDNRNTKKGPVQTEVQYLGVVNI